MKKEAKRFTWANRTMVYKPKSGVAHIKAETLADAKDFLMKHMDSQDIGIVHGLAVTLSYAPKVTIMIRGKNLYKFVQSELNERDSYRSKKSFSSMVQAQPPKQHPMACLVIYCPGTRRFLMAQTQDGKNLGFPSTIVLTHEASEDVALKTLKVITGSDITRKHVKHFHDMKTNETTYHFYLLISKTEFRPEAAGKGMVWLRHDADNMNRITKLMFSEDATMRKIIDSEYSPEKLDFSMLVDDMID